MKRRNVAIGNVYETENFMSSFYIWLRLIDKFHNREIEGKNISEMYNMIFVDSEFYEHSCRMSYSQILVINVMPLHHIPY